MECSLRNLLYSKVGNTTRIFELKGRIQRSRQGSLSVAAHYNQLQMLWQELDHNQHLFLACAEDSAMISSMIERDRIFEFLNGLNKEYEQIRSFLLRMEPLPSLREVFSNINSEESRREVTMGTETLEDSGLY